MIPANDNKAPPPPLPVRLAAVDMLAAIWRALYPGGRRDDLAARRDWRKIEQARAAAYSGRCE